MTTKASIIFWTLFGAAWASILTAQMFDRPGDQLERIAVAGIGLGVLALVLAVRQVALGLAAVRPPVIACQPATEKRLTGQDVTVHIFMGGVLQDKLTLIKDLSVSMDNGCTLVEFTAHMDCAAYIDFIKDRQNCSMCVNTVFPNGEVRGLVLDDLDFTEIKIVADGRKELVAAKFTACAGSVKVMRG